MYNKATCCYCGKEENPQDMVQIIEREPIYDPDSGKIAGYMNVTLYACLDCMMKREKYGTEL